MTDYWKSNERKFCDFCKCWLSDNKASISFHESGKRHKANVAKRISEISRNSEKAEKDQRKMDAEIRKMEEAAMRSYAQDIHARGDLTAHNITAVLDATGNANGTNDDDGNPQSSSACRKQRQVDPIRLPGNSDDEDDNRGRVTISKVDPTSVPNASLWVEGKSDEGHTYYWNVKTNESIWEAPKEGFLSLAEYQRINELALKQQELHHASEAKQFRENVNEEVARYNRERLKLYRTPETAQQRAEKQQIRDSYKTEEDAGTQEIGAWQVVENKPPPAPIDWELPPTNYSYVPPIITSVPAEKPAKRFREKNLESLDTDVVGGISTSFKKRKFAAKNNARKRLDED